MTELRKDVQRVRKGVQRVSEDIPRVRKDVRKVFLLLDGFMSAIVTATS